MDSFGTGMAIVGHISMSTTEGYSGASSIVVVTEVEVAEAIKPSAYGLGMYPLNRAHRRMIKLF